MPELLTFAFAQHLKTAAAFGATDDERLDRQSVVLVGWSPKVGQMLGMDWS